MMSEAKRRRLRLPWHEAAESLLEDIPGVVSATVEGSRYSVSEVRVWYEPTWAFGQVLDAVHQCLTKEAHARLAATRFHAVVAQPDRRTARRARPEGSLTEPVVRKISSEAPLALIGHKVDESRPGVVGVQVWVEWQGRTFSGAAQGPTAPPGSLRTPALATLRALHSCLQVLHDGPAHPGLVLEWAARTIVEETPVVVVALTASENARPRPLTAAWVEDGAPELAVIQATLHATSRTITRWLNAERPESAVRTAATSGEGGRSSAAQGRLALVDFEVERDPSGELDVGVRLAGFGEAVDRRRNGNESEAAHLQLGALATLEAVHELLRIAGSNGHRNGDLRPTGASRLKTAEHDIVIVLAEASMNGHRVPLAGATSADGGVERASITAALQATNQMVADRAAALTRNGHA